MLTPVSMELRTPPLELKIPRAVATTVWPSSSSSSSSRALGLGNKTVYFFFLDLTFNRRINYPLVRPGPLPHGDGLGHCINVIVLVFGAVVHGACEGIYTAVVVCVLGLGWYVRLQWAGAAGLL